MTNERTKTRKPRAPKAAADAVSPAPAETAEHQATLAPDARGVEPAETPAAEPVMTVDDLVAPADAAADQAAAGEPVPPAEAEPGEPPASAYLKAIVEALIYASPEPVALKALYKVLDSEPREDVERAVAALKQDYEQVRGLQLVEIAGGLQIVTRPDLHEWVRRLFHERKNTRLSVQSLETLAVIAYRQPVTAAEIAEIRGVNTSGVLATLIERKLVKTTGRKPVVGRPFLYATTREFLLRFGLNDLSDLPKVDDLADVLGFELPGLLNEPLPVDQMLPLDGPDETESAGPTVEPSPEAEAGDGQPSGPVGDTQAGEPEAEGDAGGWPDADANADADSEPEVPGDDWPEPESGPEHDPDDDPDRDPDAEPSE